MKEAGLDMNFVQDNQSMSTKGVLRGLHFQKQYPQGKLVRAIKGRVFDVAVDLRSDSKTYGQWYGVELTEDNKKQFYISEGFAHGFLVLSDTAEFCYKCTDFYHPGDEGGLAWNDPEIGIEWPELVGEYAEYGYCLNTLHSYTFEGSAGFEKMQNIMVSFRKSITEFAGKKVLKCLDYSEGIDGLPKSDVLKFFLEDNCSIVVRPSGTEPKLKAYISVSATTKEEAQVVEGKLARAVEEKM